MRGRIQYRRTQGGRNIALWLVAARVHLAAGDDQEFRREGEGEGREDDDFDESDKTSCGAGWSQIVGAPGSL